MGATESRTKFSDHIRDVETRMADLVDLPFLPMPKRPPRLWVLKFTEA
jgi:hypothetical protein